MTASDPGFEREMLARLTHVTQRTIDEVSVGFAAGLIHNVEHALGTQLDRHGINDFSPAWLADTATRIVSGEEVTIQAPDPETDPRHDANLC